jgi:hypothetical protein
MPDAKRGHAQARGPAIFLSDPGIADEAMPDCRPVLFVVE